MEFKLNRIDPLNKQAEIEPRLGDGLSPMDAPEAYAPPSIEPVPLAELHPFLRNIVEEHVPFLAEVDAFENTVISTASNKSIFLIRFEKRLMRLQTNG